MSMKTDFSLFGFSEACLEKRRQIMEAGINPYPYSFSGARKVVTVLAEAQEREAAGDALGFEATLAGRIWSRRSMGATAFLDLRDETGKLQLFVTKNSVPETDWEMLRWLEPGDILGVRGTVMRTRVGELSLRLSGLEVLAKATVPIPIGKETTEKVYYRLSDPESRYGERYLTWMLSEQDRERIRLRSHIVSAIRRRMEGRGFLEVTTPTVEPIYGGAEARPFRTTVWALGNAEAFLRISPELYLKRYIVAGFDRVFTICQNFRNEGIDRSHNPEFTMMEWYEAWTDYAYQMQQFETLVGEVCHDIHGTTRIYYQGTEIDFTPPWRRLTVLEALLAAGVDASAMTADDLRPLLVERGLAVSENLSWGVAVVQLFEALCEGELVQPTFVLDHPIEISPLTKVKRGDPRLVERFEPYVCRMEIGNAYSELTDPVEQVERLVSQRHGQTGQDYENHPVDADFLKAIGCGMPPTGGVGLGVDRLIMLLTDAPSIRDIVPFPMVKATPAKRD